MREEIIDSVVARILELGYLNDREYALRRARLLSDKGYGDFYIRAFLERLDIPSDITEEAVSKVSSECDESRRIAMLVNKRKGLSKEKMVRFLAGRGFSYDKILSGTGGDDS